ncbi:hypothetical protein Z517_06219 [Fonsecaea pedrosoi CBS 271.37]|uniref:ATP-dependent DNA ligase family profile domain-containing protein n=1 Tax=Fonsecaea pedrosoi CBS 271.37 TaxID=1442368 RepID=A0A0D2EZ50_9EURO|nr:uncharacterized protein Z517_06219 [Fonsecaea pedrosoi CBS 271.37]KIW79607.1 hypothetical protein Z517_06219 [Fonsecaea pedrosoi CBS 271.37]
MPFKFKYLVQLLEELDTAQKQAQSSSTRPSRPLHELIIQWFRSHDSEIVRHGSSAVAFLSCLLLERVPHLVYGLQPKSLARVLSKALFIENTSRGRQLLAWEATGFDFATCLEKCVMGLAENDPPPVDREVTLEEVDAVLCQLAANSRFASPEMRTHRDGARSETLLRSILSRLHSKEAKWFVRMIQKSYDPVQIPEHLVLGCFHFLLPDILPFQNSLVEAIKVLGQPELVSIPHDPPRALQRRYRQECARHLTPKLGVMIKRQEYEKARSIRHCCQIANARTMSVERKYDGWYCQVHIDKSKGKDCIQLFSKRGKDSTKPWIRLHGALEAGLRLSEPDCAIAQNCILEGEMLVWSHSRRSILPFEKIRKYIQYNGRAIGAAADSPRSSDEQLMIIFYDCLWHDNQNLVNQPQYLRRRRLEQIVSVTEGVAQLGECREIRFGTKSAKEELQKFFGHAIEQRWEGFVLKGRHDSYFSTLWNANAIKLKKDYIKGLGDAADLCIIGGRKDAAEADKHGWSVNWTTFYAACLKNKEAVQRFGLKPEFLIIDILTRQTMSEETFRELNQRGLGFCSPFSESTEHMNVTIDQPDIARQPPTILFTKPFVVEVTGAAFSRPADVAYYTLRFPRDVKLHFGRPLTDTHSFEELQEIARESLTPADPEEQEEVDWIRRLIEADGKRHQCVDLHAGGTPSPSRSSTASISICTSSPPPASHVQTTGGHPSPSPPRSRNITVTLDGTLSPKLARSHESSPLALAATNVESGGPSVGPIRPTHDAFGLELGVKRKYEASSLAMTANKRPRNHITVKRPFTSLEFSLRDQMTSVQPHEPPAVFRSQGKPTELRSSASTRREPLGELKNVRAKPASEQKSTTPAWPVDHGDELDPKRPVGKLVEKTSLAAQQGSLSLTQPAASALDSIILTVMSSSTLYLEDVKSANWLTMVFVQLVDKTYSKNVRDTIYETTKAVLKEYRRRRSEEKQWRIDRRGEDVVPTVPIPRPRRQQQQRMILFYDEKIRSRSQSPPLPSLSDPSSPELLRRAGDELRKKSSKRYFAGGLLLAVDEDTDEVVSRVIWDWRESVRLLDEVQEGYSTVQDRAGQDSRERTGDRRQETVRRQRECQDV